MDRLLFYKDTIVEGMWELDYLSSELHSFVPQYEMTTYRVTDLDVLCPDRISWLVYGVEDYWWLILYINKILDPFSQLRAGDLLNIPSMLDIYTFNKKYKLR